LMIQIRWYDQKADFNKMRYRKFQIIIIISGAIIPLINLSSLSGWQDIALVITSILGSIVIVLTAFSQMEKYFETWILYRATAESLRRERFLFVNSAGQYANLTGIVKNRTLIERVELMISSETSKYFALQQQAKTESQETGEIKSKASRKEEW
jgi:hypothetical protein